MNVFFMAALKALGSKARKFSVVKKKLLLFLPLSSSLSLVYHHIKKIPVVGDIRTISRQIHIFPCSICARHSSEKIINISTALNIVGKLIV